MLRAGYRTLARPFRNSPQQVGIRWYRSQPGVKPLPFPSVINSLNWRTDPWREVPIGEVWGAPRPFDKGTRIPGAFGDHVCGTTLDFAEGGLYDPARPPVIYGQQGLPVCCILLPFRITLGGLLAGGRSPVQLRFPSLSTGGTVSGGTSPSSVTYPSLSRGGTVAGGTSPVEAFNTFCDTYSLDPPLEGHSTLVRSVPGNPIWGPTTPAAVGMYAVSDGDGNGDWTLNAHLPVVTTWKPLSSWDGTGCMTFHKISGLGVDEVEVCCDD